jgi:beta-mannosidase
VALHVTNDLTSDWPGTVRWSLETLAGETLETGEEGVTVPALSSVRVCTLDFSHRLDASPSTTGVSSTDASSTDAPSALRTDNRREIVLVHELWQGDERISLGVVPFVPTKHLQLADPGLRHTVREVARSETGHDAGFAIQITAQRLARFVWLALEGTDVIFSDNYFDLPAGHTATVTLPALAGWTADRVRASLRVRSLRDSF